MPPYPARVDRDELVRVARAMIEAEGADRLTLGKLAKRFGVKTPSLYNHIASKTALLQAINTLTLREQMAAAQAAIQAVGRDDPRAALRAVADAYRDYALSNPRAYLLLYASDDPAVLPDVALARELGQPVERALADYAGPDNALRALRGMWALMHGFVTLQIAGQFRNDELSLEESWAHVLAVYLDGWKK